MVAALATGGAAACDAVRHSCDLAVLSADEELYATGHHAAALALAQAGVFAALMRTLATAVSEEHQKLIWAAVDALRAVFNAANVANGLAMGRHSAVLNACLQQLYPRDGSGLDLLLRLVKSNPTREVAFCAFRIVRLTFKLVRLHS